MTSQSPDVMSEARKWLFEIETCSDIETIWPEFDRWFAESAEHRAAYAAVRRRWQQLTGRRPDPVWRAKRSNWFSVRSVARRLSADRIEWHLFLAVSAALVLLTKCDSGGLVTAVFKLRDAVSLF